MDPNILLKSEGKRLRSIRLWLTLSLAMRTGSQDRWEGKLSAGREVRRRLPNPNKLLSPWMARRKMSHRTYNRTDPCETIVCVFTVRFFELGYTGNVDLKHVCRLINNPQKLIHASVGLQVESIGEPDISVYGYSRSALFKLFPDAPVSEILVGVIRAPIEDNFFSKTQKPNKVVLSLYETSEVCERAGQSVEEYLAQSALSEFLQLQYMEARPRATWEDLVHNEVRCCIFDFVPFKLDKAYKLRLGSIDSECRNKLTNVGVSADVLDAVVLVLKRIQVPGLAKSFTQSLRQPTFSLIVGGLVGGMLINLVSAGLTGQLNERTGYAIGVVAALALIIVFGNWWLIRRKVRKLSRDVRPSMTA